MVVSMQIKRLNPLLPVAVVVGGLSAPSASPAMQMLLGEPGRPVVIWDGSETFEIRNVSDQTATYEIEVQDKDGFLLERGTDYRTTPDKWTIEPSGREHALIRFKPGDTRRSLLVCLKEVPEDGSENIISRICARAVVYMGGS